MVAAAIAVTSAFLLTSAATAMAFPPAETISWTMPSHSAFFLEFTTTFAPSRARTRAIPSPIPFEDPVTIAVLPLSSMSSFLLSPVRLLHG